MKIFTCIKLISLPILACCFQNSTQSTKPGTAEKKSDPQYYTISDFKTVEKYDVHVHVNTYKSTFLKRAEEDNFRLITINWDDVNDPPPMEEQQKFALHQISAFPDRIAYATTFSIRNFNKDNWQEQAIAYLKNSFDSGAIAVYAVVGVHQQGLVNRSFYLYFSSCTE